MVVELGVYGGFSYFTFCQAASLYAPSAQLFGVDTWKGDEHAGPVPPGMTGDVEARNELYAGRSTLIASPFDAALDRFADGTVDLLHVDGVHTYEAARHDVDAWLPKMSARGVVLLHDTEERERGFGVWRLMDELAESFPTFRFVHSHGLGVVGVGSDLPDSVRALLGAADEPEARRIVRDVYALLGDRVGTLGGATAPPAGLGQPAPTGSDWLREALEARMRLQTTERRLAALEGTRSWRLTVPLRATIAVARRARAAAQKGTAALIPTDRDAKRRAREEDRRSVYENATGSYQRWVRDFDTLDDADYAGMAALDASLVVRPRISVLMPLRRPDLGRLRRSLDSIAEQVYGEWELCIADDASKDSDLRALLASYADLDARVRVVHRPVAGGVAAAANSALEVARGDVITVLDQDDVLGPHALLLVAHRLAEEPELGLVYSDQDVLDEGGIRRSHYFKPDWNVELSRSQNYLCHLAAFRADLVRLVGGFRTEFEGSHDWDLALRIVERLRDDQIGHIPHVLYHRGGVSNRSADEPDTRPDAPAAGLAAVADHLRRLGISGALTAAHGHQNVRYAVPRDPPLVSVVVPTTMQGGRFDTLLRGLSGTEYDAIELIRVADQATIDAAPIEALVPVGWRSRDVPYDHGEFNFARATNLGCAAAAGPLLLLANDDLEVLHSDWLRLLVGHVIQPGVGAVGPLLIYPDDRVQHAGSLLGGGRGAGHLYVHSRLTEHGYANRLRLNQDLSCVTAACMLLRKDAFEEVGALDESFAVAYNDVDLCLRLRAAGWRIVFTPEAILRHHESASFVSHVEGREAEYENEVEELWRRWAPTLRSDPAHNPNLSLEAFRPWHLAFPPRVRYPWRAMPAGATTAAASADAAAEERP